MADDVRNPRKKIGNITRQDTAALTKRDESVVVS